MTNCEVKMAGCWPIFFSFFFCVVTGPRRSRGP